MGVVLGVGVGVALGVGVGEALGVGVGVVPVGGVGVGVTDGFRHLLLQTLQVPCDKRGLSIP